MTGAVVRYVPLPACAGVRLAAHGRQEAWPGPLPPWGEGLGRGILWLVAPALPRSCKKRPKRRRPVSGLSPLGAVVAPRSGAVGKVVMPPPNFALGFNA